MSSSPCFRLKVVGGFQREENHTIIIANHQSFLDGLILGLVLPIKPVLLCNNRNRKQSFGTSVSLTERIPCDRSLNPMAIKQIIRLVESGRPVVIFPEGRMRRREV